MFFYRYPHRILSLEQIHAEYLDTYSDDDALPRDIVWAMVDNPHMFMKIGSFGWYSIITAAGRDPYRQKDISPKLHRPDGDKAQFFFKRPDIEPSLLNPIKEIVRIQGMARPKDIEAILREKYKEGCWCCWAQKRATNPGQSRLFQSMMYVADPACWPVPAQVFR